MGFEEFNMDNFGNDNKRNLLKQEIYKLFVSQCKNIKYLWWETSQRLPLFPGASTCFSQLYNLHIDLDIVNSALSRNSTRFQGIE